MRRGYASQNSEIEIERARSEADEDKTLVVL